MGQKQPLDLGFPVRGVNENWAYRAQPEGTTPDALNVRPYDASGDRLRGGQRPGLSKFLVAQVNGANPVQRLGFLIQSVIGGGVDASSTFTQANGQVVGTEWVPIEMTSYPDWLTSTLYPKVKSNQVDHNETEASGVSYRVGGIHKTAQAGNKWTLQATVSLTRASSKSAAVGFILQAASLSPSQEHGVDIEYATFGFSTSNKYSVYVANAAVTANATTDNTWKDPAWWTTPRTLKLVANGDGTYTFTADGVVLHPAGSDYEPYEDATFGNPYVGIYARRDSSDATSEVTIDDWSLVNADPLLSNRQPTLLAVSAGDVYFGDPTVSLTLATGGDDALVTETDRVKMTTLLGKAYFADGTNYQVFDNGTDTVSTWEATSGSLPAGEASATYSITAATSATPSFTVGEDLSALADGDYLTVTGSTANDGTYTVASTSGTGPTVITVDQTMADDTADGVIGQAVNKCRLIASYRGRIVMSGLVGDAQNWFMSAVDDPLNWDYGATSSATMAVAGNNTASGKCPDIITCLASVSDDLLIIGGDHTLWLMRGDPASGGRIDNVSQQMGVSGADAYCFDPNGVFYFFGNGALWRMVTGQTPDSLSENVLDATLGDINLSTNTIKLVWDQTNHGIHIYIIPITQGATTHYWWDARTNGFWPDQYPNAQGPTAIMVYDADSPGDRAVLLGGWDGYIRQEDASAVSDDSITINSRVKFAPVNPGGPTQNVRLSHITTILGQSSDPVDLLVYAAQSPEEVISETTPAWAYEVSTVNRYSLPRVSGNSLLVEIENDSFGTAWVTSTAYVVGDQVVSSSTPYICAEAHTSGTFSTDLAAEKWTLSTFRTWGLESLLGMADTTGRTRHGRL